MTEKTPTQRLYCGDLILEFAKSSKRYARNATNPKLSPNKRIAAQKASKMHNAMKEQLKAEWLKR